MSIFIVDDDEDIRFLYKKILEIKGYEIIGLVGDGEKAVYKFKKLQNKPCIIIMDYQLPKKNGIKAMNEILEEDPNVKVIMVSAFDVEKKAVNSGAFSFLFKPFKLDSLFQKINNAQREC
jgi:two-component system chemotaxis response regulator CheY